MHKFLLSMLTILTIVFIKIGIELIGKEVNR